MNKAVIIFVYKNPDQVNLLIKQLINDQSTDVFVHIDKKYDNIKTSIINNEHVHIIKNNINVEWGSDSLLLAHLNCCKEILTTGNYDYLISCSGADMMINNGLNEFLEQNKGKSFIDSYKQDKIRRIYLLHHWPSNMRTLRDNKYDPIRILRRLRIELLKMGLPLFRKKVTYDTSKITFYKCWFWFAIPTEIISYILEFLNTNPNFLQVYKGGLVADEGFWATIIMNSPFKESIIYNEGKAESLTFLYTLNRNSHPPTLTLKDIPILEQSGKFFARKFDSGIDSQVINYFYNKIVSL